MAIPPCSPPPQGIDWGTLLAGFALGLVGSMGGAFAQAWALSIVGRRDHQFERMLRSTDEIRHDIERATALAAEYWIKDGSHPDCTHLEAEIVLLQNKVVGTLAMVRELDPKRFRTLEATYEENWMDALTGGQFQVRARVADPSAIDRVKRHAGVLNEKLAKCSTKPNAARWYSRR